MVFPQDSDGSGGIEFEEFASLWAHLNGADEEEAEAAAPAPAPSSTGLLSTFQQYDRDQDGRLNEQECYAMMTDLQVCRFHHRHTPPPQCSGG